MYYLLWPWMVNYKNRWIPKKSSATKIGEHIPCWYSMLTISGFDHIKNEPTLYRRKDCMKKVWWIFERTRKKNNWFWMLPLTNKKLESYEDAKLCCICGKYYTKILFREINYQKFGDRCHYTGKYRGTADSNCNLKFNVLNEIPVVFHND